MEENDTSQETASAVTPVPPTSDAPDAEAAGEIPPERQGEAVVPAAAATGRAPLLAGVIVAAVVGGIALGSLTTDDSPTISGPSASLVEQDEGVAGVDDVPDEVSPGPGAGVSADGGGEDAESEPEPAPTLSAPAEQVTEGGAPDDVDLPPEATVAHRGEDVVIGDFLVTFGATDVDAAWRFEGNESSSVYVDELADDEILVLGTVTVTNRANEPLDPTVELFTSFLGTDGREYNLLNGPFCMAEDSLMHLGNLAPGQTATGSVCQGVPAAAALGGVWQMRPDSDYSAVSYFASHAGFTR